MTWVSLLLADPSPCLRTLVLRDLLLRPADDPEVQELAALRELDTLAAPILAAQNDDGSWTRGDPQWQGDALRMTFLALMRLGFLGFDGNHPTVARGAEYLFSVQNPDGSWKLQGQAMDDGETHEGYTMIPMQTSLPLRGLAMVGYAEDPRAERAYAWLMDKRLDDGAWPTGYAAGGVLGRVAGYRKLPHSRWGCRANTTGVLLCLAYHPQRHHSEAAQRALDLLLGRETREARLIGNEVTRLIGAAPTRGFTTFYARFDLAMILDLCWRIGATLEDSRVRDLVNFIQELQGEYGLWQAPEPQASRWLTFDLLRSLSRLDEKGAWVSQEPRTPFQTYPKQPRRY